MYREMCVLMRNDGGTLLPFFNNWVYARGKGVERNEDVAASWSCDGARAASRWWFSA
jgi:peptide/nickel transport system substrate-binding protein